MKNAYMNPDYTVREILPKEAVPIEDWYNREFASHCMEVPDHVEPNWEYDPVNNTWYEPGERPVHAATSYEEDLLDVLNLI